MATELAEFLADQLRAMGHITTKRMFSGAGVWCDGLMFALIIADTIYLKADDTNRGDFEAEGMSPFTYQGKARRVSLGYWRLPERLLDEPDELIDWARKALAAARKAAAGKAKSAPKPRRRVNPRA
jgi:DNA transformation protein